MTERPAGDVTTIAIVSTWIRVDEVLVPRAGVREVLQAIDRDELPPAIAAQLGCAGATLAEVEAVPPVRVP